MWEATDPDGRCVVLTFERWRHITERHPELGPLREAVLDAIAAAVAGARRGSGEEWFYAHGLGPSRFVRVVVHFRGGSGSITTAFPRRRVP